MTINQITYAIREGVRQYQDDTELSDSYIQYLVNIKRSKFLRNDLNNLQKTVDNSILQTLCLELEEVPATRCSVNVTCDTIMRTKRNIPRPIELHLRSAITSVRSVNRVDVPFNFITKDKAVYQMYSPFNKAIYVFLDDDAHLYFISNSEVLKMVECVTVTGIFENPLELQSYSNCCGCEEPIPCYNPDSEYPLQSHHFDNIRTEILNTLLNSSQIKEDKVNDATD